MARVKFEDLDKYTSRGSGNYFSLKDDGDVATVRFLFDTLDDIPIRVHDIKIGDTYRTVECLRSYDDPVSKCPLCAAKNQPKVKLYMPLVEYVDDEEIGTKIWQRPQSFSTKIGSQFARYKNFSSHFFEIERHGRAGDQKTTYELFEVNKDDKSADDYEVPNALGTLVMQKTAEEMDYFLDNGDFPQSSDDEPRHESRRSERVTRRTPANRNTF